MLRKLLTVVALTTVLTCGGLVQRGAANTVAQKCPNTVRGIRFYQNTTWKWQSEIGVRPTRTVFNSHKVVSCDYAKWIGSLWRKRSHRWHIRYTKLRAEQRATLNHLYDKWSCIHRYEGSWSANTGNGYYGGLQMDMTFMRHYGPEFLSRYGTANNWPIIDQLIAAERAYSEGRGFYPWPNTARACGLI